MSLTYNSEHLAWKQRVGQEKTRADTFYKTTGSFFSYNSPVCRSPFPNASQDSAVTNYRTLEFSLGYAFGGTKPIRNATYYSPQACDNRVRHEVEGARSPQLKKKSRVSREALKRYAEELKVKIEEEKSKRISIEKKLKIIT